MKRLKVSVTQEHIRKGKRRMGGLGCPVFLALKEHEATLEFHNLRVTSVSSLYVYFGLGIPGIPVLSLPEVETQRIRHYDRAGEMEPHTFTLDISPLGD